MLIDASGIIAIYPLSLKGGAGGIARTSENEIPNENIDVGVLLLRLKAHSRNLSHLRTLSNLRNL